MQLSAFYPYVLPEVQGCPDPMLAQAVRSAVFEFCRETLAWTELQDAVPLVDGVADYELNVPSGAFALTVRDVWVGARRLTPVTLRALGQAMPDWQTARGSEPSHYNSAAERGVIRVFPMPLYATAALTMRVAYAPTATATTAPDFLGQRHMEAMAAGAKARLLLIPGMSWSNPALGAHYRTVFEGEIFQARIEEAYDRTPGSLSIRPRSFGF